MDQTISPIDPKSGFNPITKIFHSMRPPLHLPLEDTPFTIAEYALSRQADSLWPDAIALINSATGQQLSYSDFTKQVKSLAFYLQNVTKLSKNDTMFILCPNSIQVSILYFSLLSLGVIVSPANPINTESEILHQFSLSKPVIAFAVSATCHKLPKLKHRTILMDSPEFDLILTMFPATTTAQLENKKVKFCQSDLATILYSLGTTGRVKGVMLTHRNLMAVVAGYAKLERQSPPVMLYTMPLFHVFGFFSIFKSVALSETVVVMERFELKKMLRGVEEFKITHVACAPPVVVAMAKSDLVDEYDIKSLEMVACGGAPLGKDVIKAFADRFPMVDLWQVS